MDIVSPPTLARNLDKSKIPPIHQKRILAFVNHFILTTSTFLNNFSIDCENKFIEIERKLQKVEASLMIIDEKLASIPALEDFAANTTTTDTKSKSSDMVADQNNSESIDENLNNNNQIPSNISS